MDNPSLLLAHSLGYVVHTLLKCQHRYFLCLDHVLHAVLRCELYHFL